ncbi:helix-turn-helix transcriptional regulator [Streptomyces sp. TS71-3]|uniref:helix-turn-helix domain-containing protein n=1 Tax=Streptomyces sp. TS71-3 TaxID=2733862 RepID=UPI001BB33CEF|nr:helix-turn-helix transcriptional regulator [Streptomyces sp. TS71-3]
MSTVLGRRLGSELLRLRDASGKTQIEAAEVLGATNSKIVKMESGWVPMRDLDIKALCELYGAEQKALSSLLCLARLDRDRRKAKGWWQHPPHAGAMSEYIAMEDAAMSVRTWQLSLIPGLFQTAEYARSLAVSDGVWEDPDEIERVVEVRMKRQARVGGDQPLQVHAVVWEAALRQLVGGVSVMRAQLQHLRDVAELPNVRLQIMAFRSGGHPCVGGSFNILSFAEAEAVDVVHIDTTTSTVWMENGESSNYRAFFDGTARRSLAPMDSIGLLDEINKGMDT